MTKLRTLYAVHDGNGVVDTSDSSLALARLGRTAGNYTPGTTFVGPSTTSATSGRDRVYAGDCTREFYYNGQYQMVEETATDADTLQQYTMSSYVYDQRYVDAPVMTYRDTNADGTVDQKLYVTQDASFDVTATVDGATGSVVNRFVYTPYGQRTVLTSTWTAGTTDFMLGHQGLMLDSESGLYYNRARYLHPTLGTFTTRDPLGYVDGMSVYQYERGNSVASLDPSGLAVTIGGEKWDMPSVTDLAHVHSPSAAERRSLGLPDGVRDLGVHLHGPDGSKFFPRYGVKRDANGRYSRASNSFMKSYESQRERVNKKLAKAGLTGMLLLLGMMANEACGANDEYAERIRKDIQKLRSNAGSADKDLALADMVDAVSNMFGSDLAGLELYNDIDASHIPSPEDDWKKIGEIEVD